jgi:NADH-quinone oxidoreductase subunit N
MVSVASMAWGAFAAIRQENIKRLMAYSSIGNMGYALLGLAAGTEEGIRSVVIYMIIYLAMSVGTFACILSMRRGGVSVERIADLAGLWRNHPRMALALLFFMFSMAGIPPLAGFFGKLNVFLAAINAGLYWASALGVAASVVGAYYYLRIIKIMFFDAPKGTFAPVPAKIGFVMAVTGLFVSFYVIWPGALVDSAGAAAKSLF